MNKSIDEILPLLQEETSTSWVAEQIKQTFRQGISMNVRESLGDAEFFQLAPSGLSTKDKSKREKYETTRPYSASEKETIIISALETLYIELPAIQLSALNALQEFGLDTSRIEFTPPDEPEQGRDEYSITYDEIHSIHNLLRDNFNKFKQGLS